MSSARPSYSLFTFSGMKYAFKHRPEARLVLKDTFGPVGCLIAGHRPYIVHDDNEIACHRCGRFLAFPWNNNGDRRMDRALYREYLAQICTDVDLKPAGEMDRIRLAKALINFCEIRTKTNLQGMLIGFEVPALVIVEMWKILDQRNKEGV